MTQAPNTPLWAKSPETGASKDILAISREKTLFQYFNGFSGNSFGRHWRRNCRNPCQIQGAHPTDPRMHLSTVLPVRLPIVSKSDLRCVHHPASFDSSHNSYVPAHVVDGHMHAADTTIPAKHPRSSQLCAWTMLTCTPLVKNLLSISQGGLRVILGMETDVGAIFPAASAAYATSVHGCMWRWASTRQVSLHPSHNPYGVCNCSPAHRSMTSLRCTSLVPSNRTLL